MRRISAVVFVVLLMVVPAISVAGLKVVVEGDADWDCLTMGNGVCGPDVDLAIEGAPGRDCLTFGNGVCGEEPEPPAGPIPMAPPFTMENGSSACGPVDPHCEAHARADVRTGRLDVNASIFGTRPTCDVEGLDPEAPQCGDALGATALSTLTSEFVLDHPVQAVKFTINLDLHEVGAEAQVGEVRSLLRIWFVNTGCNLCASSYGGGTDLILASSDPALGPAERGGTVSVTAEMRHRDGQPVSPGTIRLFPQVVNFANPDVSEVVFVPAPTPDDPDKLQTSWMGWGRATTLIDETRVSAELVE